MFFNNYRPGVSILGRFPGKRKMALNTQQKVLSLYFSLGDYSFIEFRLWQGPFQVLCPTDTVDVIYTLRLEDRRVTEMAGVNSKH